MKQYAFDTSIAGHAAARTLWGTICQDHRARFVVTQTTATEMLRRVQWEGEREWRKKLRAAVRDGRAKLDAKAIRRCETEAGKAMRKRMSDDLRAGRGYHWISTHGEEANERNLILDEQLGEELFDTRQDNGVRDRRIVLEALTVDADLLISNNLEWMDTEGVKVWIEENRTRLGIPLKSSVLTPAEAETKIRMERNLPTLWTFEMAVAAFVPAHAQGQERARALMEGTRELHERGMTNIQSRIARIAAQPGALDRAVEKMRTRTWQPHRAEERVTSTGREAARRRARSYGAEI